jgi:hypothetical protein
MTSPNPNAPSTSPNPEGGSEAPSEIDRILSTDPLHITDAEISLLIQQMREERPKFLLTQKTKKLKAETRTTIGFHERKSRAKATTLADLGLLPPSALEAPPPSAPPPPPPKDPPT